MLDITAIKHTARTEVLKRLDATEKQHQVRVLLAIESGSRAWGFPSPNSDYDARFVYTQSQVAYLKINIENLRDVIEYPILDEMDINGWDLRKALKLLAKSNPSIIEWLHSPIIYRQSNSFISEMKALAQEIYDAKAGMYHYLNMAKRNYMTHLDIDKVRLKKYFYVLRPLLAVRWLKAHQSPPPIEFHTLLAMLTPTDGITDLIEALLIQKKEALEDQIIQPVIAINRFIEKELQQVLPQNQNTFHNSDSSENKYNLLNDFFLKWTQ